MISTQAESDPTWKIDIYDVVTATSSYGTAYYSSNLNILIQIEANSRTLISE